MKKFKFCFAFLLVPALHQSAFSQMQSDSSFYHNAIDSVYSLYTNSAAATLLLYNGREYQRSPVSTTGFPFFEWDHPVNGAVFYGGNLYQHVNLQYDIAKDELVIENYLHNAVIQLVPDKIDYFTLEQHSFIKLTPDKNMARYMAAGFYEKLNDGAIMVLARREKKYLLSANAEDNSSKYVKINYYYAKKDGVFYPIADKQSLLALFKDKKDQLKKFIREEKIRYDKNPEASILRITTYYLQLIN